VAIDIMTAVKGLEFNKTFEQAKIYDDGGLKVRTIHKNDLENLKSKNKHFLVIKAK